MERPPAMPRALLVLGLVTALVVAMPPGASAKDKKIVAQFMTYERVPGSSPVDSIDGVTFELQGLWGSPGDVPDLFGFSQDDLIAARIAYRQRQHLPPDAVVLDHVEDWFPKDPHGLRWINPFMSPDGKTGLFALRVKVRNRTSETVRMADWRIYLRVAGRDEAIPPSTDLAFYDQWMLAKEVAMNGHKEGPLAAIQKGYTIRHIPYPVGIAGAILAEKIPAWSAASLLGKVVPAGASGTGYLFFPVEMGAEAVSVTFVQARAGSATEGGSPRPIEFKYRKEMPPHSWNRVQKRWIPRHAHDAGR